MPDLRLQRACACGGACSKCQTERHDHIHERVQATRVGSGDSVQSAAPPLVNEALAATGQPLDSGIRDFMESRFGHDFSQVRVHTGGAAAQSSQALNARAYTVGSDIVFGVSQFAPGTNEGRKLLAHELTHVVQQAGAGRKNIGRSNGSFDLSPTGVQPLIQRDLAIEPPRPAAVGRVLTPAQLADAIRVDNRILGAIANSADIIEMLRDVIGISPLPAVVDDDFVRGVVQWQANFGLTQDGQLGPATARPLFREIGAEGVGLGELLRNPRYTPAGPINVARAGARTAHFDMAAEFRSDPRNGISPPAARSGRIFDGMPLLLPRRLPLAMVEFRMLVFLPLIRPILGSRIEIKQAAATDTVLVHFRTQAPTITILTLQVGKTKPSGICFGGATIQQASRRIVEVGASGLE
ncbi:MAG: DUF4157 domain-containing protein [Acidobacteriota bacterium]